MSFIADSGLEELRLRPRNRPDEAGQFAGHGHADLVGLHAARTQAGKALGQPQLGLPAHSRARVRQSFLASLRPVPMRGWKR